MPAGDACGLVVRKQFRAVEGEPNAAQPFALRAISAQHCLVHCDVPLAARLRQRGGRGEQLRQLLKMKSPTLQGSAMMQGYQPAFWGVKRP